MILKKDGIKGKTTLAEIGSCVQVVKHSYVFIFVLLLWRGSMGWGGQWAFGHKASDGCAPRPPLWAFTGTIYSDPHSRETFNIGYGSYFAEIPV